MQILVLILVNAAAFAFLYVYVTRRIRREIRSEEILNRVNEELGSILTDINHATERNVTLVEDRIRRLGELIEKADGRIKLLTKKEEVESTSAMKAYQELGKHPPVQAELPIEEAKEDSLREKILRYHREGVEPRLIASRLHVPEGEVELIISLGKGS